MHFFNVIVFSVFTPQRFRRSYQPAIRRRSRSYGGTSRKRVPNSHALIIPHDELGKICLRVWLPTWRPPSLCELRSWHKCNREWTRMDANRRECGKGSWVVSFGLAFIGVYSRLGFKAGRPLTGVARGTGGGRGLTQNAKTQRWEED